MNMDEIAKSIVEKYIRKRNNEHDKDSKIDIYIVWKCKTLQNWKYLISTDIPDGRYYELTYNGDKKEWYFDVYKKMENGVIPL